MKNFTFIKIAIICMFTFLLCGCASTGPFWDKTYNVPLVSIKNDPSTKIIVSGFVSAEREYGSGGAYDIALIMESASAYDMSNQIAAALQKKGLNAEAIDDFDRKSLLPGQYLLRGAVVAGQRYSRNNGAFALIFACSICTVGTIIPSPIAIKDGYIITYRIDLLDHLGKYVLSIPSEEARIFMKVRTYIAENRNIDMFNEMRKAIAEELSNKIKL